MVFDFGGFDLASGKRLGFSGGTEHLKYYQPSVSSDGKLFVHKPESPHTDNPNPDTPHYLNLDYELHQGTKLDYLFFESSKMLEGSEIQLLNNLCEQEKTQILTILMLSMENPRLAGYMLTGNRSMFLSNDGSLAWLYHCPLRRSPPHVMNQCYDKILIFYKMEYSSSTQSLDKLIRMPKSGIAQTGLRTFSNSTWKMRTRGSMLRPH